jgi:hypothetical protein
MQKITELGYSEAVKALRNGEVLERREFSGDGTFLYTIEYDNKTGIYERFCMGESEGKLIYKGDLEKLHRQVPVQIRKMTRYEMLNWANSDKSKGWLVNICYKHDNREIQSKFYDNWQLPQQYKYDGFEGGNELRWEYRMGRLNKKLTDIDEKTIRKFEIPENTFTFIIPKERLDPVRAMEKIGEPENQKKGMSKKDNYERER